jgi:cardiolipin synthase
MFSEAARARMLERGWRASSLLMFFRDSWAEARGDMQRYRPRVREIVTFALVFHIVLVLAAALLYGGAAVVHFALWSLASGAAFTAWTCASVGRLRALDGTPVDRLGIANYLTLARFYLIAPVVVLFDDGHTMAALAAYVVLGLSDVVDGMVARWRGERSEFGVLFDPLADVFSTAAIFAVFLAHGLVPAWLFLLLLSRYIMLFAGSFLLFLLAGPIRFKATIPGKVVGVVQASAVTIVIVGVLSRAEWLERIEPVLFPLLGVAFSSIIISQLVIGLRHLRSRTGGRVEA